MLSSLLIPPRYLNALIERYAERPAALVTAAGLSLYARFGARLAGDGRNVRRLQALRTAGHLELDAGAFIQRTIAVRLNGGKVHEYILACFALDESEAFRRVKPLHCTFLSHSQPLEKIADRSRPGPALRRKMKKAAELRSLI
jgi:hypothetical protein